MNRPVQQIVAYPQPARPIAPSPSLPAQPLPPQAAAWRRGDGHVQKRRRRRPRFGKMITESLNVQDDGDRPKYQSDANNATKSSALDATTDQKKTSRDKHRKAAWQKRNIKASLPSSQALYFARWNIAQTKEMFPLNLHDFMPTQHRLLNLNDFMPIALRKKRKRAQKPEHSSNLRPSGQSPRSEPLQKSKMNNLTIKKIPWTGARSETINVSQIAQRTIRV